MAAKKTQGSKPFAGQTGRKPQGPQGYGMSTSKGSVSVRQGTDKKGNRVTVAISDSKKMIKKAEKSSASGLKGKSQSNTKGAITPAKGIGTVRGGKYVKAYKNK